MRFRKKPVVIEAVQWKGDNFEEIRQFTGRQDLIRTSWDRSLMIPSREGLLRADRGDWIMRGVMAEIYPIKPEVFALTYEPVD